VSAEATRQVVYCVVPRHLVASLLDLLRRHFRSDPSVVVIAERRGDERRAIADRRSPDRQAALTEPERRRVLAVPGRRVADRRVMVHAVAAPLLPRKARPYAEQLVFLERVEPSAQQEEDLDTARLVARFQEGDREAFSLLYMRYFDRVYEYFKVMLRNAQDVEEATQTLFARLLSALPSYERRAQPFRAWLFTIARNLALDSLRKQGRMQPLDPEELGRRIEEDSADTDRLSALEWISNPELMMLIERLPLRQRQVLVLRYFIGLSTEETASVLDISRNHVSVLTYRSLDFLRARLAALGRATSTSRRPPMRRPLVQARILRRRRFVLTP
jgi:RNA polymerase sigma-70 factor, ECF subfamily